MPLCKAKLSRRHRLHVGRCSAYRTTATPPRRASAIRRRRARCSASAACSPHVGASGAAVDEAAHAAARRDVVALADTDRARARVDAVQVGTTDCETVTLCPCLIGHDDLEDRRHALDSRRVASLSGHSGTLARFDTCDASGRPQPSAPTTRSALRPSNASSLPVAGSRKRAANFTEQRLMLRTRAAAKVTSPPCGGRTSGTASPALTSVNVPDSPSVTTRIASGGCDGSPMKVSSQTGRRRRLRAPDMPATATRRRAERTDDARLRSSCSPESSGSNR